MNKELNLHSRERQRAIQRVTLLGAAVDAALGIAKLFGGVFANSQALIADGIHSLSDVVSDAGVMLIAWMSGQGPDANHPYGHGRIETLGTLMLGALLIAVAGSLAWDSLARMLAGEVRIPTAAALLIALLSILLKEWVFRITRKVAEQTDSHMVLANAWHSRSDAFSSGAVLVGVGGAMAGFPWLDLAAAVVVAGMIGWIGWDLLWRAVRELVDTGLPPARLEAIHAQAMRVPGVLDIHHVRSRTIGNAVLLELDIVVPSTISVSEGHQIARRVAAQLPESDSSIRHVQVHVDPDAHTASLALPLRPDIEDALARCLQPRLQPGQYQLGLHYAGEHVDAEVHLEQGVSSSGDAGAGTAAGEPQPLETWARLRTASLPWLRSLRVWTRGT